jgi:hypothetical protein
MKPDYDDLLPSEVTKVYWLYAKRKKGNYPNHTRNGGKWLIFVDIKEVDVVWMKIKSATEDGLLGGESKVATAIHNQNATNSEMKVICVYSYDYTDKDDVMRIREALREIGIKNKIPYKTDNATSEGKYRIKGHSRISVYYE